MGEGKLINKKYRSTMKYFSVKSTYLYACIICFLLLAIALYLQLAWNLIPCLLCMIQRFIILLLGLLFLMGSMFHRRLWLKIHAMVIFSVSFLGILVSGRQVWLQYFYRGEHVSCSPSLSYMLEHMPFNETLKHLFEGNSDCGLIEWSWLDLSIPAWTLIFFVGFCILAIINFRRV